MGEEGGKRGEGKRKRGGRGGLTLIFIKIVSYFVVLDSLSLSAHCSPLHSREILDCKLV